MAPELMNQVNQTKLLYPVLSHNQLKLVGSFMKGILGKLMDSELYRTLCSFCVMFAIWS